MFSEINFPFVYLDSSSILRSNTFNTNYLTKNFAIKKPDEFLIQLNNLRNLSQNDTNYYQHLMILQERLKMSSLITCETANEIICNNKINHIALFGTIQNPPSYKSNNCNSKRLILWGDDIDIRIYNQAAMIITQADYVIADPCFFKVSVGTSLINYISSKCKLIILGTETINLPYDIHYTRCPLIPQNFAEHLLS